MFFHVDGKMSPSSRICKNAGKQVEPAFLGTRLPPLWTPIGRAPLILTLFSSPPNLKKSFGEWCNGSTADSGSACLGSNPSSPASASVYLATAAHCGELLVASQCRWL